MPFHRSSVGFPGSPLPPGATNLRSVPGVRGIAGEAGFFPTRRDEKRKICLRTYAVAPARGSETASSASMAGLRSVHSLGAGLDAWATNPAAGEVPWTKPHAPLLAAKR